MGFALAAEAVRRGATVTLVAGPTSVDPPRSVEVVRVRRAAEMHREVMDRALTADVVIMAAAVADYTPLDVATDKIAKKDETLTIQLTRTVDILAELARPDRERGAGLFRLHPCAIRQIGGRRRRSEGGAYALANLSMTQRQAPSA